MESYLLHDSRLIHFSESLFEIVCISNFALGNVDENIVYL
jgi:hypothetical protein